MEKLVIIKQIQKECKNIGPKTAPYLYAAGIHGIEDLRKLGAEEAFFQIWKRAPGCIEIHSMYLWALEGAIQEINCLHLPKSRKEALSNYAQKLRDSLRKR